MDPVAGGSRPAVSTSSGTVLSAAGLVLVVFGIMQADTNGWLMLALIVVGALFVVGFFVHVRVRRARREGAAALDRAVQEPHVEPRTRDAEPPMAPADGHLVRRVRVPASRSRLQRDPNRCHLHRRDGRHPRLVARGGAVGEEVPAADADPGRVRRHARRASCPARAGEGFAQRVGVRAGTPADRPRPRHDAHAVGQRRSVELPEDSSKARSRDCRGASPTSARRSGLRLLARSSCPG